MSSIFINLVNLLLHYDNLINVFFLLLTFLTTKTISTFYIEIWSSNSLKSKILSMTFLYLINICPHYKNSIDVFCYSNNSFGQHLYLIWPFSRYFLLLKEFNWCFSFFSWIMIYLVLNDKKCDMKINFPYINIFHRKLFSGKTIFLPTKYYLNLIE